MRGASVATAEAAPERQLNGMSIAALCCGLFPVTCFLGIAFGLIAIHQIRTNPQRGLGLALSGIAVGAAWFVIVLLIPE
jgi:hypothetical protein